jgi:hypothetical protein
MYKSKIAKFKSLMASSNIHEASMAEKRFLKYTEKQNELDGVDNSEELRKAEAKAKAHDKAEAKLKRARDRADARKEKAESKAKADQKQLEIDALSKGIGKLHCYCADDPARGVVTSLDVYYKLLEIRDLIFDTPDQSRIRNHFGHFGEHIHKHISTQYLEVTDKKLLEKYWG